MKQFLKSLLVYFFILFFVIGFFKKGLVLPTTTFYLLATLFILSFTEIVVSPLLKFLTIKLNFFTFFLMSSILLTGVFYLLKIFMTGLYINTYIFEGAELGTLQISSFTVTPIITIIGVSIFSSLICSIYKELDSV